MSPQFLGESLLGTLGPDVAQTLYQAFQNQQNQELAAKVQAAAQAASQAQGQYQQAAAQPAPELNPADVFAPTLLGGIASVLTGSQAPSERAAQTVQASRAAMLKARADNLQALQDVWNQKAQEAQKAGDLETELKARTTMDRLAKTHDALQGDLNRANRVEIERMGNETALEIARINAQRQLGAGGGTLPPEDVESIADAIARGDQPPVFTGLYRSGGPVRAALARRGVNVTKMQSDWNALTRHYSSLNGTIQLRLRQAAENARGSVTLAQDLSDQLSSLGVPRSKVTLFNRASLAAIRNGAFGDEAAAVATQLEGQIGALQSELANVYQGGGVPTDEARKTAQRIININMSPARLKAALELANRDIGIRLNAVSSVGAASPSNPPTQEPGTFNIGPNPLPISQANTRGDAIKAARTGDLATLRRLIAQDPTLNDDPEILKIIRSRRGKK